MTPEQIERKREKDRSLAKTQKAKSRNGAAVARYRLRLKLEAWGGDESMIKYRIGQHCCFASVKCSMCDSVKRFRGKARVWTCAPCAIKAASRKMQESTCPDCGKKHLSNRSICRCPACKHIAERADHRRQEEKRQMIKRGVSSAEGIWRKKVFDLDGWRCRTCKCKVQKKNIYADNAAELDHIIPLSKGGTHTYDNVQTLCRRCNQRKLDAVVPTQMRLALIG